MTVSIRTVGNLEFSSVDHEQRFYNVLEVTEERSGYFADDRFYQSMIYILTSDFCVRIFDQIVYDTNERFEFELDNPILKKLSSTETFMVTYALNLYFNTEHDYRFSYWFYQLDPKNQDVMMNSLKFIHR